MKKTSLVVAAAAVCAVTATPVQAVEPCTESPATAKAVKSGNGYDVVVGGAKRATVKVTGPAYTVRTTSSANGRSS